MKLIPIIIFIGLFFTNCADYKTSAQQDNSNTTKNNSNSALTQVNGNFRRGINVQDYLLRQSANEQKPNENEVVPVEFKHIDFENFIYPNINPDLKEGEPPFIRLKKGKNTFEYRKHLGVDEFEFGSVNYIDFTNDENKEALVNLSNTSCGGSCGVFEYFYIYSIVNRKPKLLWKMETGSQSNCGLINTAWKNSKFVVEVFGNCDFAENKMKNKDETADIEAFHSTTFKFIWNGAKFVQESREVTELKEIK